MPHELALRLSAFFTIFLLMALWETVKPFRPLITPRVRRWPVNLSLVVLNSVVVRLIFSVMAVQIAALAGERHWGLLNRIGLPSGGSIVLAIVFLDLIVYLQHLLFHFLPILWRLHMMHHADLDFDVTTGTRFHPLEIVISFGIKAAAVNLSGAPPLAVVLFEVILNGSAMFNHGNVRLPLKLDRWLRLLMVTPDMHRVHHSVVREETNSNFGFNLPWWDRIFGTYRPGPSAGQEGMTIGLSQFKDPKEQTLSRLLFLPFTADPGNYPIKSGKR